MGTTAVKISEELAMLAREEAEATDRSMTGQIEHWAKLGRSVEASVTIKSANALKKTADLNAAFDDQEERAAAYALLAKLREELPTERLKVRLKAQPAETGVAVYEADPENLDQIVRILPDGTRESGAFEGDTFKPS